MADYEELLEGTTGRLRQKWEHELGLRLVLEDRLSRLDLLEVSCRGIDLRDRDDLLETLQTLEPEGLGEPVMDPDPAGDRFYAEDDPGGS